METEDTQGRWILFFVSWCAAVGAFFLFLSTYDRIPVQVVNGHLFGPETHDIENQIQFDPSMMWSAAGIALVTLLFWPIAGTIAVWAAELLREIMYPEYEVGVLEKETPRAAMAAIWPLRLLYAIVVYPAMGIIRRLFPTKRPAREIPSRDTWEGQASGREQSKSR